MASSKRERELARMRAERQAARRAAAEENRRRRRQTVLAAVAGLAIVGIVTSVVLIVGNNDSSSTDTLKTPAASGSPTATASAGTGSGSCTYNAAEASSKKIDGKPPTSGVETVTPAKIAMATSVGEIDLTLNTAKAPCTVNSFTYLTKQKYFDGTTCHRLTTSGIYVLQCGDPTGTGSGGPGYKFAEENLTGAVYPRGTVAMARAQTPGTNGSQFFLVYKDSQLPPDYTPFGSITAGLDVLDKVAKAGAKPADDGTPNLKVTLTNVTIKA